MIKRTGFCEFRLDGADALRGLLDEFPIRIQRDILNASARAGATVLRKEIRKNIKQNGSIKSGKLYNSIKVRKEKSQNGVFYIYSNAPHAHLVEFGTVHRELSKPSFVNLKGNIVRVTQTGMMPAKPFFRPAIIQSKQEVLKAVVKRMAKRMAAEAEKMTRKWGTLSKSYKKKLMK